MYDMYPWDKRPDTTKPEPAINAVQIALDRRDNGGDATAEVGAATYAHGRPDPPVRFWAWVHERLGSPSSAETASAPR